MKTEEIAQRVAALEEQMRELRELVKPSPFAPDWRSTVGMFSDDADFDEILELGRKYRQGQKYGQGQNKAGPE